MYQLLKGKLLWNEATNAVCSFHITGTGVQKITPVFCLYPSTASQQLPYQWMSKPGFRITVDQ